MNFESAKIKIRNNFRAATTDISSLGATILEDKPIRPDLGARTPKELIREATLGYVWANPAATKNTPVGKAFHTLIDQIWDTLDQNGVLNDGERNALLKDTGIEFIRARKLGPTLNELGELNMRQRMVP